MEMKLGGLMLVLCEVMAVWRGGVGHWHSLLAFSRICNSCGSLEGWQGLLECHMEMKLGGLMFFLSGVVAAWRDGRSLSHSLHAF